MKNRPTKITLVIIVDYVSIAALDVVTNQTINNGSLMPIMLKRSDGSFKTCVTFGHNSIEIFVPKSLFGPFEYGARRTRTADR